MTGDDRHHKLIDERYAAWAATNGAGINRLKKREKGKLFWQTLTGHLQTHGVSSQLWNPGSDHSLSYQGLMDLHTKLHEEET